MLSNRAITMRTSRALTVLAFSLAAACSTFGQIQRRGMSPRQEFLLCAQKVLGKTVLWQGIFFGRIDTSNAPQSRLSGGARRVYCGIAEK